MTYRSAERTFCLITQGLFTLVFIAFSCIGLFEVGKTGEIPGELLFKILRDNVFGLITIASAIALYVYYRQDSGIEAKLLPQFFVATTLSNITLIGRFNFLTRYSIFSPNLILKVYLFSVLMIFFLLIGAAIFFQSLNGMAMVRFEESVLLASVIIAYLMPVQTASFGAALTPFDVFVNNGTIFLLLAISSLVCFIFNYGHDSTKTSWTRSLALVLADFGITIKLFFNDIKVSFIGVALFTIGMVIFIIETRRYNIWD